MADNRDPNLGFNPIEDEFSAALRPRIRQGLQTEMRSGEAPTGAYQTMFAQVRRRRSARIVTATTLSAAFLLGVGMIGWQVSDNLRGSDMSDMRFPTVAADPDGLWDGVPGCDVTIEHAVTAPVNVNGHTVIEFTVDAAGAPRAVIAGPDSSAQNRDPDAVTDDLPEDSLWFSRTAVGAIWFQTIVEDDAVTFATARPAYATSTEPVDSARNPNVWLSRAGLQWTVSGPAAVEAVECPVPEAQDGGTDFESADRLDGTPAAPKDARTATPADSVYVVIGYLPVLDANRSLTGNDGAFVDADYQYLYADQAILVQVADGNVTELSRAKLESLADQGQTPDSVESPDTDKIPEDIERADGTALSFEYHDAQLPQTATTTSDVAFTMQAVPTDRNIRLIAPSGSANRWIAARYEAKAQHDVTRLGTWSSDDIFTPWPSTDGLVPGADDRWMPSIVTAADNPDQIVWIERLPREDGTDRFWIFAANAQSGEPTVLVSDAETANNTADIPGLAVADGRVYWSQEVDGTSEIRSLSINNGGASVLVATDVTDPVAGLAGVFATQLDTASREPIGVVRLTTDGAEPYLKINRTVEDGPLLQVAAQHIAVTLESTTFVVPIADDAPVWAIASHSSATAPVLTQSGYLFWEVTSRGTMGTFATALSKPDKILRIDPCVLGCGDDDDAPEPLVQLTGAWDVTDGVVARIHTGEDIAGVPGYESAMLYWPSNIFG